MKIIKSLCEMRLRLLAAALLCVAAAAPAAAQNYTTVTASNISLGNAVKLATGQICFLGVDQNNRAINYQVGGGGQVQSQAMCATVTNGAIVGTFQVPNPANTSPSGILYRVWVKDTSTGNSTSGQLVIQYPNPAQPSAFVSFTGSTYNFDLFQPAATVAAPPAPGTVTGNLGITGNLSATGSETFGATTVSDLIAGGPWKDVRKYGAVCDGATNDGAALQTALNTASVTGTAIFFPSTQCVSNQVLTFYANTRIFSLSDRNSAATAGVIFSGITIPAASTVSLLAPASSSTAHSAVISGLTVDYSALTVPASSTLIALNMTGGEDSIVEKNSFLGPITSPGTYAGGPIFGVLYQPDVTKTPHVRADYFQVRRNEFARNTTDVVMLGGADTINSSTIVHNILGSGIVANQPVINGNIEGANLRLQNGAGELIMGNSFNNPGNNISFETGSSNEMMIGNYFDSSANATWVTIDSGAIAAVTMLDNRNLNVAQISGPVGGWAGLLDMGLTNRLQELYLSNYTPATASLNRSMPPLHLQSRYWNGSADATDDCTLQPIPAIGTNPAINLALSCTGSSGTHTVTLSTALTVNAAGLFTGPTLFFRPSVDAANIFQLQAANGQDRVDYDSLNKNVSLLNGMNLYVYAGNFSGNNCGFTAATGALACTGTATWGGGAALASSSALMQQVGTLTTTAAASDVLTNALITVSSHCTVTATNATAAGLTGVYVTPAAGSVTIYHSATAGGTFAVACSVN